MWSFIRLIRWPNLVIIIITQYLLFFRVLLPTFTKQSIPPTLNGVHFFLLVFSTVCIAAAAYIINDILDYEIDKVNKPKKVFVNRFIPLATANRYYYSFNAVGLLIGIYLSVITLNYILACVYLSVILMMWWYSKTLKKQPFIGNLIIALNCALVPILVLLAESTSLQKMSLSSPESGSKIYSIILAYTLFAFLSTLFREIVKDMEDIKGDKRAGANTLPIAIGLSKSKQISYAIAALLIIALCYWSVYFGTQDSLWPNIFVGIGIILPILYTLFELRRADTKEHFHCVSQLAKYIILSGLIYLIIYKF